MTLGWLVVLDTLDQRQRGALLQLDQDNRCSPVRREGTRRSAGAVRVLRHFHVERTRRHLAASERGSERRFLDPRPGGGAYGERHLRQFTPAGERRVGRPGGRRRDQGRGDPVRVPRALAARIRCPDLMISPRAIYGARALLAILFASSAAYAGPTVLSTRPSVGRDGANPVSGGRDRRTRAVAPQRGSRGGPRWSTRRARDRCSRCPTGRPPPPSRARPGGRRSAWVLVYLWVDGCPGRHAGRHSRVLPAPSAAHRGLPDDLRAAAPGARAAHGGRHQPARRGALSGRLSAQLDRRDPAEPRGSGGRSGVAQDPAARHGRAGLRRSERRGSRRLRGRLERTFGAPASCRSSRGSGPRRTPSRPRRTCGI